MGRPDFKNNFNKNISIRNRKDQTDLNRIAGNKHSRGLKFVNASEKTKLGKDGFMKILAHQLKNQDPTNPMDQKQLTADLAQMSQLEQMTKMNASLDRMNPNSATESQFYAASFLGKEVMTAGTTIKHAGQGSTMDIPISLPQHGKKVMVRITDAKGQMLKQIDMENLSRGNHLIKWDGTRQDGVEAKSGIYNISVMAMDNTHKSFKGETKTKGLVTDVRFENGETVLKIDGGTRVFLRDVESFSLPRDNKIYKPKEPAKKLDG